MKVRWHYPLVTFAKGSSPEALILSSEFKHEGLNVKFNLSGEKPFSFNLSEEEKIYGRKVNIIDFLIEEIESIPIEESDYPSLLKLLVPIINRVLRGIRNFGFMAAVNEINPLEMEAERYLRRWDIEVSKDEEYFAPILKKDPVKDFLFILIPEKIDELDVLLWADIEESIQDDIAPSPEQEFLVDTLEYLKNRNYRMSLVESIMCLEVVTNQYLEKYMALYKKIPRDRIDKLLQPQLGLSARIAALLDFCLDPDDIAKIEFNNVLTAIRWRNHVMHKTGHLPNNLPEDKIQKNIISVLELVSLLAMRRNQIETSPEMQKIGKMISEKLNVPLPNILATGSHRVLIEFVFFVIPSNFPKTQVLEEIAQEASKLLSERDPRFIPEKHLYIKYYLFPREIRARWYKGTLHLVPSNKKEIGH